MNARSVRAIVKALENQRERVDGPIIDLALEFAANRVIDRVSGLGRAIAIGRTFAAQVFLRIERLKRGQTHSSPSPSGSSSGGHSQLA